ncbi:MAG: PHP domain-containing protein [Firmicutes bacterium]|nr:PHP domain-containing protein [Bacillota bacterium]
MNYNYHTHTTRCGHASGTEREYIERAVANGVRYMGFSDHATFVFPDGFESHYRVPLAQAPDYFETISALREEYKDRIDIKIGFEMEYYPAHFDAMLKLVKELGAEYLILGQHFIGNEHPDGRHTYGRNDSAADLKEYVDCVVKGIQSGAFTYVAHPDVFSFVGDDAVYKTEMRRICEASKACTFLLKSTSSVSAKAAATLLLCSGK